MMSVFSLKSCERQETQMTYWTVNTQKLIKTQQWWTRINSSHFPEQKFNQTQNVMKRTLKRRFSFYSIGENGSYFLMKREFSLDGRLSVLFCLHKYYFPFDHKGKCSPREAVANCKCIIWEMTSGNIFSSAGRSRKKSFMIFFDESKIRWWHILCILPDNAMGNLILRKYRKLQTARQKKNEWDLKVKYESLISVRLQIWHILPHESLRLCDKDSWKDVSGSKYY